MNYNKQLEKDFVPMATANPEEVSFKVAVNYQHFTPSDLPSLTMPYANWSGAEPLKVKDWGDYVYTGMESEGGLLWFFFAKNKTEAEKNTPFRTVPSFDKHEWDAILKALTTVQDSSFPQTTIGIRDEKKVLITAPRTYVKEVFVPAVERGTWFQVDEFLSPTKFNIPQYSVPIPSMVSYDLNGKQGIFPNCLHDDLNISDTRLALGQVYGDVQGVNSGILKGQFFPATNFTEWAPHYIKDVQEYTNGVWYRKRTRVSPPQEPETISK